MGLMTNAAFRLLPAASPSSRHWGIHSLGRGFGGPSSSNVSQHRWTEAFTVWVASKKKSQTFLLQEAKPKMFSQLGDESVKNITTTFFSCACPHPAHFCPTGQSGVGMHVSTTCYGLSWALSSVFKPGRLGEIPEFFRWSQLCKGQSLGFGGFILFCTPVRWFWGNHIVLENVYIEKFIILVYSFPLTKEMQLAGNNPYQTCFQWLWCRPREHHPLPQYYTSFHSSTAADRRNPNT